MTAPDDLITDREARSLLGNIPSGTMASMRYRRQIPFYRLGSRSLIRYSRRELLEWIASRRIAPQELPVDEFTTARVELATRATARKAVAR